MNFKLYSILYVDIDGTMQKSVFIITSPIFETNTNIKPAYIKRKRFNTWHLIVGKFPNDNSVDIIYRIVEQ